MLEIIVKTDLPS